MKIAFNSMKSNKNEQDRGLAFDRAIDFEWETALYSEDTRRTYPEQRFVSIGYLDKRLHVLCFTPIAGGIRVISFRKANLREVKRYEKESINK